MEIKITIEDGITIITPIARIDTFTAKAFEDGVMSAINSSNKIAICFNEIDYISSAGLRVVLMAGKKLMSLNGKLALVNMPEKVFSIFKMSGFDKILKIYPSLEESKPFFNQFNV